MPDNELLSAIQESLPEDAKAAPSPASEQAATPEAPVETPTPKVEQEQPFHTHPRWIERQEELKREREEKQLLMQQIQEQNKILQQLTQKQTPVEDPLAGVAPEERQAWERIEKVAERIADQKIRQKEEVWAREVQATKEAMAVLAYKEFQKAHPDVLPNSPEENAIADFINRGYRPEDAYKVVMFDKNAKKAAEQVKQQVTHKTQQKMAANLETQSIPPTSGLPKAKQSFREMMDQKLREAGI